MRSLPALLALALLLTASSCGPDGSPSGPDPLEPDPTIPGVPTDPTAPDPPDEPEPPAEPPPEWAFVPISGAQCRDGSATGVGLREVDGATDLLIAFDGGGACFNAATCKGNRASYGPEDFATQMSRRADNGIFSLEASNPVADWTAVYVPYCTGDLHGGTAENVAVPGVVGLQQFVGHLNLGATLDQLAPTVGTPERVLVAGGSAGGYGALFAFDAVARRYPDAELFLLTDSGPLLFDDAVFSPAFGGAIQALFGLPASVPDASLSAPDALQSLYAYYAQTYPDATLALASYTDDPTIRDYLEAGQPGREISADAYATALRNLERQLPEAWHTYIVDGTGHVFVTKNEAYNGRTRAPNLSAWLADLLAGRGADVEPGLPEQE